MNIGTYNCRVLVSAVDSFGGCDFWAIVIIPTMSENHPRDFNVIVRDPSRSPLACRCLLGARYGLSPGLAVSDARAFRVFLSSASFTARPRADVTAPTRPAARPDPLTRRRRSHAHIRPSGGAPCLRDGVSTVHPGDRYASSVHRSSGLAECPFSA